MTANKTKECFFLPKWNLSNFITNHKEIGLITGKKCIKN